MRKLVTTAAIACGLSLMGWAPKQAEARKEYMDAFIAKYSNITEAKEKKCLICHGAESKKQRNDYSMALEKALGKKMEKDVEKINGALTEVEGKEYEDGKTYGALLKSGKLPAPFKE